MVHFQEFQPAMYNECIVMQLEYANQIMIDLSWYLVTILPANVMCYIQMYLYKTSWGYHKICSDLRGTQITVKSLVISCTRTLHCQGRK